MDCKFCTNFEISQKDNSNKSKYFSPQNIINLAKEKDCQGICFSYNEPIIYYEYLYDLFILAKKNNLNTILKTNAYINEEPWNLLLPLIDALNIDYKGNLDRYKTETRSDGSMVLNRIRDAIDITHTEISIPVYYDAKIDEYNDFYNFISDYPEVPIHLLKLLPAYKNNLIPVTSSKIILDLYHYFIEKCKFVYIHNDYSDDFKKYRNTYVDNKMTIERNGFESKIL